MRIFEEACHVTGRDAREIEKSWGKYLFIRNTEKEIEEKRKALAEAPPGSILCGTPDKIIDEIKKFVDLGFTYFTFRFEDMPNLTGLRLFAEKVIPAFK